MPLTATDAQYSQPYKSFIVLALVAVVVVGVLVTMCAGRGAGGGCRGGVVFGGGCCW